MKILVWIFAPLSLVEPVYLIYKIVTVSLDIRVRKNIPLGSVVQRPISA